MNDLTVPIKFDGLRKTEELLGDLGPSLLFVNLVDTDMLYGHRRDPAGYARAMEEIDRALPAIASALRPDDLLVISTGRQGRLTRMFHGGVSRYCLAHARCDVLAVPPSELMRDLGRGARVLDELPLA